jgi:hypothetical protein
MDASEQNLAYFRRLMVEHLVEDLGQDEFIVSHIETGNLTCFLNTLMHENPELKKTYYSKYRN